jgi:DNA invertase Pin-like site-specific DNA recombinase
MPYHSKIKTKVKIAPRTLGVCLGRLAIRKKVSVQEIATKTGASRTTVYNWFSGGGVTNAYKERVQALLQELKNA